jgi:alpha-galactosidase
VSATVDDRQIIPGSWEVGADGVGRASVDGIELAVEIKPGGAVVAKLTNRSSGRVRLGRFSFAASHAQGAADFLATPGRRLRVHKEGLTMATPAASLRYGDRDFELNPEYKPFAVLAPAEYRDDVPNRFSAEYAAILNDRESGASALFGFVSSADQFTRVVIELEEQGVARLEAISCGDGIAVDPGESVCSEELVVLASGDAYGLLEAFASRCGKRMNARTWRHTPTGWCSWYYYFAKVTEADMVENIRWLKANKAEFPLEYIQLDDGYQSALGDWLVCNEKFPKGLPFLIEETKAAGFKPGLWLAPFLVEERSLLYQAHSDWMVKDKDGQTVWAMEWRGSRVAILDGTVAAACDWLAATFATLREWGYDYVKLDFMVHEIGVIAMGGRYADPKATRAQALRRGLEAIRRGFGEDKFIVGCTCPLATEVGVVNGARIGTDITPYWQKGDKIYKEAPTVPNVCRNVINRSYMHRRLWLNDPDTHIARIDSNDLTEAEVKLWTSAVWLAGGVLLLSDRFSTLTPERAALSTMLLKAPDAFVETRPLDFLEREFPAIWFARSATRRTSYAVGVFNFDPEAKSFTVALPLKGTFKAREFWSNQDIGEVVKSFSAEVPPHACKVFLLEA